MQAIQPYTQIYGDIDGQEILKKIERCGRVCYKSEGRIEEGSAEKFVAGLIKRGHEAVLEHASIIVETNIELYEESRYVVKNLEESTEFKSFLRFTNYTRPIISGNVRAWRSFFEILIKTYNQLPGAAEKLIKNNPIIFPEFQNVVFKNVGDDNFKLLSVSDLQTDNEKLTHQDVTVKFVVDRGVSHEIVRHRLASYCQESTRYCNYAKDDFGKEITFIIPHYLDYKSEAWNTWKDAMKACEDAYFKLLDIGLLPQEARAVLPNSLKTEVVMTANLREWRTFFKLRTANAAHPQMLEVTRPLLDELKELIPVIFDDITY
jgi:thymidylate synthase (FAD)